MKRSDIIVTVAIAKNSDYAYFLQSSINSVGLQTGQGRHNFCFCNLAIFTDSWIRTLKIWLLNPTVLIDSSFETFKFWFLFSLFILYHLYFLLLTFFHIFWKNWSNRNLQNMRIHFVFTDGMVKGGFFQRKTGKL